MGFYYPVIDCALVSYAEDKHLKMDQVARRMGLSRATFFKRRCGQSSWTVDELRMIAAMTSRTYEDLMSESRRKI